jgi:hypothetical protein
VLWVRRAAPGVPVDVPAGLLLQAGATTSVIRHDGGAVVPAEQVTLVLWQLETSRPAWALDQP